MGLCSANTKKTNQILDARKWYFGETHCRIISLSEDVLGDQENNRFELHVINEEYEQKNYIVELLTDINNASVVPSGYELIPVIYVADQSASDIADLLVAALEATGEVKAENVNGVVHAANLFLGKVSVESYTNAGPITMEIGRSGFGGAIGAIAQGGGTLSTETSLQDITSDDTADLILDQINKGASVSISMTLAEMTDENWLNLVGKTTGDVKVISAQNLVGFGTSKLYKSSFDFAGMLVGHPVRLAFSDRSKDIVLWKTQPAMDEINFSGQDVQGASFTFNALNDFSKPVEISLMAKGNYTLV